MDREKVKEMDHPHDRRNKCPAMILAKFYKPAFLAILATSLSGCLMTSHPTPEPPLYQRLDQGGVSVNPDEALSMINNYRLNNGKGTLKLDEKLTRIAQEHSAAMANAGKVSHSLNRKRTLPKRLKAARYDAALAVENISAGYWTLAEAFSGWRDSKQHNANMLREGVTHMGIATHYRPDVKYKVYWTLILAKPDQTDLGRLPIDRKKKTDSFADLFAG